MAKIFSNKVLIVCNTELFAGKFLVHLFLCPGNLDTSYFILLCKIFYLLQVVGVEQHSDRPNLMYLQSNLGNHF